MKSILKSKLSVTVSFLMAVIAQQSFAEDTQTQVKDVKQLETLVVTGTAHNSAIRKLDAGFSISTASQEKIQELAPQSTADLMKIVPGVFAETTGGVAGLHVGVRGFPQNGGGGFATVQLDGSPIFVPSTLDFLEGFSLFRVDETIERMEVLRGGPSPIFSNGNPGLTVNFIQKKGKDIPEGTVGVTLGSEGLYRVDGYYGGKIADGWYGTVGGFYRQSDGIRDTQYPADDGGQLSATLSKRWGDGNDLTFYVRKTRDSNAFFTPAPLLSNNGNLSTYPGFDQRTDTLQGNDLRNLNLEIAPNQTLSRDYSDGRTIDLNLFGTTLNLNFDKWTLSNRASVLKGTADVRALFTSATPLTLGDYISGRITAVNSNANIVNSVGQATSGSASYATTGQSITDLSTPVIVAALNSIDKDIESFSNDLRLSRHFGDHTVTVGAYLAHYRVDDLWYQGNNVLLSMEPNAQRINLYLDNGVQITRDGFVSATTNQVNASYSGTNYAAFLADEWQILPELRIDAGVRFEYYKAYGKNGLTTANVD
ncbi:MAG: TonB-dependent receptor plug domain-containing protein, partial [Acinetobacter sp.]